MNEVSLRMIEIVASGLEELNDHVAFVGGAVAGVYANDSASEDARHTMDVDCVLQLGKLSDQYALEDVLRRKHFQHDIDSGVIFRWTYQEVTVDIMPDDERVLGFSNRWYNKGLANRINYTLPNKETIHIFPVTYYLATKLEAIASRGGSDLRCSHDFEDFIFVLNGRTTIEEELRNVTDDELRVYLAEKFRELRNDPNIEECITCALPIGEEERCEYILSLLSVLD